MKIGCAKVEKQWHDNLYFVVSQTELFTQMSLIESNISTASFFLLYPFILSLLIFPVTKINT